MRTRSRRHGEMNTTCKTVGIATALVVWIVPIVILLNCYGFINPTAISEFYDIRIGLPDCHESYLVPRNPLDLQKFRDASGGRYFDMHRFSGSVDYSAINPTYLYVVGVAPSGRASTYEVVPRYGSDSLRAVSYAKTKFQFFMIHVLLAVTCSGIAGAVVFCELTICKCDRRWRNRIVLAGLALHVAFYCLMFAPIAS